MLDPDQDAEIKLPVQAIEHQADPPLGSLRCLRLDMRRLADEGAAPLHAFDQSFGHQRIQGLAYCPPADLIFLGQLELGGQARPRCEAAIEDALAQIGQELAVERCAAGGAIKHLHGRLPPNWHMVCATRCTCMYAKDFTIPPADSQVIRSIQLGQYINTTLRRCLNRY